MSLVSCGGGFFFQTGLVDGWAMRVLNSSVGALDMFGSKALKRTEGAGGGASGAVYGGSPHLHGVEGVAWTGPAGFGPAGRSRGRSAAGEVGGERVGARFEVSSLDVPILSTGGRGLEYGRPLECLSSECVYVYVCVGEGAGVLSSLLQLL
jgi:hypothetical protein